MIVDPQTLETRLLIDGKWQDGSANTKISILNPSSGQDFCEVENANISDLNLAIDSAYRAFSSWKKVNPRKRSEILGNCYLLMHRDQEFLAHLISLENGKSLKDARSEVLYAAEFFRWYSEEAVRIGGELGLSPNGSARIIVQHQPVGVALLITPWNFPAAMATRKIAPALAAGCTCILKPSEETPLTALAIAKICHEAGVPNGCINVIPTDNANVIVDEALKDRRIKKLSFTGSTKIGKYLLQKAAARVVNCSMELGGNAPFIVFDDADVEQAVSGAMLAKMRNGGEACTAANRFYIQAGVYQQFVEEFTQQMRSVKLADGVSEHSECGPMINFKAISAISSMIDDAVFKGAIVETGGKQVVGNGFFFQPTVLTNVSPSAKILKNEIFGPVAPIVSFNSEEEALRLANDTDHGLVAYIFTRNLQRGLRISEALEYGMIGLNRGIVSEPAAPFGGMKESGVGREGGHSGMMEYLEPQYISTVW